MNNGPNLGVPVLGGPLFLGCPGPWASSITNQSKSVKFALGLLHLVIWGSALWESRVIASHGVLRVSFHVGRSSTIL